MRRVIAFLVGSLLCSAAANAQVPSGNAFFGYSFYSTSLSSIDRANTNGWEATLEGKVLPFIGLVADVDSHYGSQGFPGVCSGNGTPTACAVSGNVTEHNYLFGPRAAISLGKLRPFAEAMVGASHVNVSGISSGTCLGTAVGGGLDYKLFTALAWRVQGDYVHTHFFNNPQNNVRISTGIVFRF